MVRRRGGALFFLFECEAKEEELVSVGRGRDDERADEANATSAILVFSPSTGIDRDSLRIAV